jgi:hypothetical protein
MSAIGGKADMGAVICGPSSQGKKVKRLMPEGALTIASF